jgi:hypothetical protein
VVETGFWDGMGAEGKEEFLRKEGEKVLTGRVGRVGDVVDAFLYVMWDGNVTGEVVNSNGGVFWV